MVVFLLLGLYYPTVAGGSFTALSLAVFLICLALLATLIFSGSARKNISAAILLLSIVPLLFVFTALSPLPELRLGASVGYGALSVFLLTDVRDISLQRWHHRLWTAVNIANLVAGIGILLGTQIVDDFIVANYSYSYDGMVRNMMTFHKPVVMFGTHSIAAFFWYLFFWINLEGYRLTRRRMLMFLAICNLLLSLSLLSVTGVILFCIGIVQLMIVAWMAVKNKFVVAAAACVLLGSLFTWGVQVNWRDLYDGGKKILQNPEGGLMARYLPGGTMYPDLEYLSAHPFWPVGFSYKTDLLVGDSGIIEYVTRGSVVLLFLIYGGLYFFLRRNLILRSHAWFLFCVLILFETGITALTYFRTLFLLPTFIVYLNSFQRQQEAAAGVNDSGVIATRVRGDQRLHGWT